VDVAAARGWLAAHRFWPWLTALGVASVCLTAFANAPVPTWTQGTPLPLWALTPAIISLLAATVGENQLDVLIPDTGMRPTLARLMWTVIVVGTSMAAAEPVGLSIGQPLVPEATGALVAVTLGLSTIIGKAAAALGGAVAAVAVTFGGRVPAIDPLGWLVDAIGSPGVGALLAVSAAAVAAYAYAGSRSRALDDSPE